MARADRSLRSAHVTLQDGDPNAGCSHAYYAMFYAARAALLALGEEEAAMAKTHSGLIAAFNRHMIRTGEVATEHGRNLGAEANRRLVADYEGDPISPMLAGVAISHATTFVVAIRSWIGALPPKA
jgi:uncharacterized protein (UPF0332 family)